MSGGTMGNVGDITAAEKAAEDYATKWNDAEPEYTVDGQRYADTPYNRERDERMSCDGCSQNHKAIRSAFLAGFEWAKANPLPQRTHDEWLRFQQRALAQAGRRLSRLEKQLGLGWMDDSDLWEAKV